ncbi:hypothetical protein GTC054_15940 [Burkholderia pseudomallei]|nr:hypothetical protein GTC054_15940 [Burkholderia pseudomallei]
MQERDVVARGRVRAAPARLHVVEFVDDDELDLAKRRVPLDERVHRRVLLAAEHHDARPRVFDDLAEPREMVIVARRVRGHRDETAVQAAEERAHVIEALRADDQHPVARRAARREPGRDAPRGAIERAEAERAVLAVRAQIVVGERVAVRGGAVRAQRDEIPERRHCVPPAAACRRARHSRFSNA